jgi:toxin secretion/phage lysis holin
MLIVLIFFIVIDYISGVISAAIAGQLSSAVGFKGILKKVLIFIVVAMAVMVDRLIGQPIIRTIVIMFYIANEGLSILENLGECGVPYPAKLKAIIASLNNESSTREE